MIHELPALPYDKNALAPLISGETLDFHHGKHHKTYVDNLNQLIRGTEFESLSLEDIIRRSSGKTFNNAAQTWNHSFYWNCLTPPAAGGEKAPQSTAIDAIRSSFGSLDDFKRQFTEAAVGVFGSGWTWLVRNPSGGKLEIVSTGNAGCPLTDGKIPLLTCDVWEHAYYIDYRNARAKYVESFWKLANWAFVQQCFDKAGASQKAVA